MIAIHNRIFIVFAEDAALVMVILLPGLLLAYNKLGNTSTATIINREAMVTEELMNAYRYLRFLSNRGMLAIDNNITNGKMKNTG